MHGRSFAKTPHASNPCMSPDDINGVEPPRYSSLERMAEVCPGVVTQEGARDVIGILHEHGQGT